MKLEPWLVRTSPRRIATLGTIVASVVSTAAHAAPLAAGDLLMSCEYWGITRIEPATGEQHPLGVGSSGAYATLAEDAGGLVWIIDNRWLVSIDPGQASTGSSSSSRTISTEPTTASSCRSQAAPCSPPATARSRGSILRTARSRQSSRARRS